MALKEHLVEAKRGLVDDILLDLKAVINNSFEGKDIIIFYVELKIYLQKQAMIHPTTQILWQVYLYIFFS